MTITAKVIADSVSLQGHRITTMQLRYPRFIHAEAKTHRVLNIDDAEYEFMQEVSLMDDENLSRNASSSRAVPIERMIQDVIDDPAMPVAWGANKRGMQAGEELSRMVSWHDPHLGFSLMKPRKEAWLQARDHAVAIARGFANAGYHKQIANRLLEPFGHISVVVTATEWDNFFDLRCHPDADPTMVALAHAMRDARDVSEPLELLRGEWHLPYIDKDEVWVGTDGGALLWDLQQAPIVSAARCARVSYLNHDGTAANIEKDLTLAKMLLDSKHMSPFEHQARPTGQAGSALWGNFTGWDQFRKMIEVSA